MRRALAHLALAVTLAFLRVIAAPRAAGASDAVGRVVDAGSGEALQGAVVVVVTHRLDPGFEGPIEVFSKAVEALSDDTGRFAVDVGPGVLLTVTSRYEQRVAVFKPGYRPYVNESTRSRSVSLLPDETVRLVKITDPKEMAQVGLSQMGIWVLSKGEGSYGVPPERIPKLMRLLRLQRKLLESINPAGL